MSQSIPIFQNCGWVISDVICGAFTFVDLGGEGVVLGLTAVGTGSDVVCANKLSTASMMVISVSVWYWRLLTTAVEYVWAVSVGMWGLCYRFFSSVFSFFKAKGYCFFDVVMFLLSISGTGPSFVNIITGSGIMAIFFYKGLTRNSEIGNTTVWVLPNIWRLLDPLPPRLGLKYFHLERSLKAVKNTPATEIWRLLQCQNFNWFVGHTTEINIMLASAHWYLWKTD